MADTSNQQRDDKLDIVQNKIFRLDFAGYEGKTDSEKRQIIKQLLDACNFAINPSEMSKAKLAKVSVTDDKPVMESEVIIEGVVYVQAYYDGTDKTGEIKAGQQVVFDTVTGHAVTGINENWAPTEYKIVGTSLVDYNETGLARIPIRLSSTSPSPSGAVLCYANEAIAGGGPNAAGEYTVNRADTGAVRMKEERRADGSPPSETNIRYVLVPDFSQPIKVKIWTPRGFSQNEVFIAVPESASEYYLPQAHNLG